MVWSVIHEAAAHLLASLTLLRIVKHGQTRERTVMDLNQIITQRSTTIRYTPRLTQLRENLKHVLVNQHTKAVYVELSDATCTSSRYAHVDLYESVAVQYDPYRPYLPDTFGFTHTYHQTTLVWYLTYFTIGNWRRLPIHEACMRQHNCLLEVFTLSEVIDVRGWR